MRKLVLGMAAAMFACASAPASAAVFDFSFSGTGLFFGEPLVGSGTLTTDDMSQVSSLNGYNLSKYHRNYRYFQRLSHHWLGQCYRVQ